MWSWKRHLKVNKPKNIRKQNKERISFFRVYLLSVKVRRQLGVSLFLAIICLIF